MMAPPHSFGCLPLLRHYRHIAKPCPALLCPLQGSVRTWNVTSASVSHSAAQTICRHLPYYLSSSPNTPSDQSTLSSRHPASFLPPFL